MLKFKNFLLYVILFIILFFIVNFIYMNVLYQYTLVMFDFVYYKNNPSNDFIFVFTMDLIITFILTTFVYQIIRGKLSKSFIKFCYLCYFISLIYFLFFKTVGITGYNLNILNVIKDFLYGDALIVFMNILFFIPFGFLFKLSFKNSFIFIILITLVELIQMIFKVGIFDIADIILNYSGFVIGTALIENDKIKKILIRRIYNV